MLPLRLVAAIGVVTALAGLATGVYSLTRHVLVHVPVSGFASITAAILMLGGIQLLALGVIGEYLGRAHLTLNPQPQYTERVVLEIHGISSGGCCKSSSIVAMYRPRV